MRKAVLWWLRLVNPKRSSRERWVVEIGVQLDPRVQRVIDTLQRSKEERTPGGTGWFAEAMGYLLQVSIAEVNGQGPTREESERLWNAVHETLVEHPDKLHSYAIATEMNALRARDGGWRRASWGRSVLEFIRTHPKFVDFGEPLEDEDMASIDEPLREAAPEVEPLTPKEVPAGVPASHWWWRAPSATP